MHIKQNISLLYVNGIFNFKIVFAPHKTFSCSLNKRTTQNLSKIHVQQIAYPITSHGRGWPSFHSRTTTQAKSLHHSSRRNSHNWSLSNNQPHSFRPFCNWKLGEGDRTCMPGVGLLPSNKPWSATHSKAKHWESLKTVLCSDSGGEEKG